MPDLSGNLAQQLTLRFGQHQFVPGRRRLDSLGQVVEPGAGLNPASVPKFAAELLFIARARTQDRASSLNVSRPEAELRDDVLNLSVEPAKVPA